MSGGTVERVVTEVAGPVGPADGKAPAYLMGKLAAIRVIHRMSGAVPPDPGAALAVIKSYRRERAAAGIPNASRAPALSVDGLRTLVAACATPLEPSERSEPVGLPGLGGLLGAAAPPPAPVPRPQTLVTRDQFLLVLGWAMMARRGELAALNLPDVVEVAQGLEVTVRQSKNDQHAVGRIAALPHGTDPAVCPVRLWRAWTGLLAEAGITDGALFRRVQKYGNIASGGRDGGRLSDGGVYHIVKRTAERAGLTGISPHSLRAGGATGAYIGGADPLLVGRHGGWHDGSRTVLRYLRDLDRWQHNPMRGAGP